MATKLTLALVVFVAFSYAQVYNIATQGTNPNDLLDLLNLDEDTAVGIFYNIQVIECNFCLAFLQINCNSLSWGTFESNRTQGYFLFLQYNLKAISEFHLDFSLALARTKI